MELLQTLKRAYSSVYSLFVKNASVDYNNLPVHIGIIMDGNGRWAKRRGLERRAGHAAGAETLRQIADFCDEIGIKALTVYAFSTENWKRPKAEVDALMELLYDYLKDAENKLMGRSNIVRVIGDISKLSDKIQARIADIEELTKNNNGMVLNLAINYGGRDEIVRAAKQLAYDYKNGLIALEDITQKKISEKMYTSDLPDPDLIIRPSGELRTSNFLLWQSAYSEYWFSNVCWPDFTPRHLLLAIEQYQRRNRRYGGI